MKFFPYPVNAQNLGEFTRPGSTLLGHVVKGEHEGEAIHLAGNGFVAVMDLLTIESSYQPVRDFPAARKKLSSLPWEIFEKFDDHAQYHHDGLNRKVASWVSFDDHSGGFAQHRDRELFKPTGEADLFGYYTIGAGRVAVPPQVLNLVRKLPRARFWVPRLSLFDRQAFLPVTYNGGRCLIGNLPEKTAARLPEIGTICANPGRNPLSQS